MGYPILYILMRTDMDSMNPGKGMAQAAHAANQFIDASVDYDDNEKWAHYNGYGTTVVLAVDSEQSLKDQIKSASDERFDSGLTVDPSYPVRDGNVTHLINIPTCGYIFVPDRDKARPHMMENLSLHP